MRHAKKIVLPFDIIQDIIGDKTDIDERYINSFGLADDKDRICQKHLPRRTQYKIKKLLPKNIRSNVLTVSLSEIGLLAPHVHITDKSVINLYIKTNNEKTFFWDGEIIPDDYNMRVKDNGNGYWTLSMKELTPIEYFIAQSGDIWILDTQKPHSVSFDAENYDEESEKRIVIQIYFDIPFSELHSNFEETMNIF